MDAPRRVDLIPVPPGLLHIGRSVAAHCRIATGRKRGVRSTTRFCRANRTRRRTIQTEKTSLERQKFELEQQRFKSENRWKLVSAVGAVLSAALTFAAAHVFNIPNLGRAGTSEIQKVYIRSNDFLSSTGADSFIQLLKGTQREAWFVGTSFYISIDTYRDELIAKARGGVDLYFLMLDPSGPGVATTAHLFDMAESSVTEQCVTGIRSLRSMINVLRVSQSPGRVYVRLSLEPLASRLYFFDPRQSEGATYYVPQVNSISSQALPGHLIRNKTAEFHAAYFQGVSKLWNSDRVADLDTWLPAHPQFEIK